MCQVLSNNTEIYCLPLLLFLRVQRIDRLFPKIIFIGGTL